MTDATEKKIYIGDTAVYVWIDRAYQLVLETSNGIEVTNRVFLEPQVWDTLCLVLKRADCANYEEKPEGAGTPIQSPDEFIEAIEYMARMFHAVSSLV